MANSKKFRILAFDPGLTNFGYSLLESSTSSGDLVVLKIGDLHPGPVTDKVAYRADVERFDKRTISLAYLREQIEIIMNDLKPDFVVSEDIYLNPHRVQAYGALCMVICVLRMMLRDRYNKYLVTIPTKVAKRECCGSGSGGKIGVQDAIMRSSHLVFKDKNDRFHLSEHVADSIAVGIAFRNVYEGCIKEQLGVINER